MPRGPEVDTVMNPVGDRIAGVYAEAVLAQLPSDREAEEVAAELDALAELLDQVEGFEDLMTAALIPNAERARMVQRIFHDRVSEPVEALLVVMAGQGRLGLLRALRRVFRSALYRRQGKREVTVFTAGELNAPQRARVAAALADTLRAEPVVTYRVDADLLGGMVVRVGDHVYDASIRSELENLQGRLRREIRLGPADRQTGKRGLAP